MPKNTTGGSISRREFVKLIGPVTAAAALGSCTTQTTPEPAQATPTLVEKATPTRLPTATPTKIPAPTEVLFNQIGELPFGKMGIEKIGNPKELELVGNLIMTNPDKPIFQFADPGKVFESVTNEKRQEELLDKDRALLNSFGNSIKKAKIFEPAGSKYQERKVDLTKTTAYVFRYQEIATKDHTNFVILEEQIDNVTSNYYFGFAADSDGNLVPPKDGAVNVFYPIVRQESNIQNIIGIAGIDGKMLVPLFNLDINETHSQFILLPFADVKDQIVKPTAAYPSGNMERMLEGRPELNFLLENQLPAGSHYEIADFKGEKTWVVKGQDGKLLYVYKPGDKSFVESVNTEGITQVDWSEAQKRGVTRIPVFNTDKTKAVDFQPDAIYKTSDNELLFLDKFGTETARLDKEDRLMVTSYRNSDYLPISIECEELTRGKSSVVFDIPDSLSPEDYASKPFLVSLVTGENDPNIMDATLFSDYYTNGSEAHHDIYNEWIPGITPVWQNDIHNPNLRLISALLRGAAEIKWIPQKFQSVYYRENSDTNFNITYKRTYLSSFMPSLEKTITGMADQNPGISGYLQFEGKPFSKIKIQFMLLDKAHRGISKISVNEQGELVIKGNFDKPLSSWDTHLGWIIPKNIMEIYKSESIDKVMATDEKLKFDEARQITLIPLLSYTLERLLFYQDGYPILHGITTN